MTLHDPFVITSRLMAGVKIGSAEISVGYSRFTSHDGRTRYQYCIDHDKNSHESNELFSGVMGGGLLDGMESLLSFLGAAADAYRYNMRGNGRKSDNSDLFPEWVMEWAYMNSSEIDCVKLDIEDAKAEGKVLIEE